MTSIDSGYWLPANKYVGSISLHAPLETSSAYETGTGIGTGTAANVDNRSTGQKVKDMFSSGHSSTTTTGTHISFPSSPPVYSPVSPFLKH